MTSLSDFSHNLYCIDKQAIKNIYSLARGLTSYSNINDVYIKNCPKGNTDENKKFIYQLSSDNFINPSNSNYIDNCQSIGKILASCDSNIASSARGINDEINSEYNNYMNTYQKQLYSDYSSVVSDRANLDQKIKQVMGLDDSLYEKQNIVDSAVLTTLLWTALATSVLYYTFTKL